MNANGTKIIRLKNDYLTFVGESLSDSELETNVRAMCELKQFLDEHKIPLLYVQFPHKVHRRETQLPFHFQPVANENADRLLTALRAQGIDCYDMRELLDENPDLHYALFWRGDHHWRNEYTLLAGRRLGEILTTQYHFENSERFWSQENYHQETEAFNWAHTSQVTKTGRFFALRDVAHTHYVPKFPTDIHEEPIGCQKNNVRYSNRLASSGKKIFLIHDSFSNQTLCNGLAFSCQELTLANVHNGDRMSDLIDTIKPDIVIVAYWAGKIIPEMFAF